MLLREYSSTDYVNTHCLFNSGDVIGGKAWTSIVVLLRCKSGTALCSFQRQLIEFDVDGLEVQAPAWNTPQRWKTMSMPQQFLCAQQLLPPSPR